MNRIVLSLTAALLLAGVAQAQPAPGREPPNPDADRDGKVTLAEFKTSNAQRQDRMFARMDANKDGKVTQAEAEAAHERAEAHRKRAQERRGPVGMVARMDANKDGAVTRAELATASERQFQVADANKDGWLSKEELLTMRHHMRGGHGRR